MCLSDQRWRKQKKEKKFLKNSCYPRNPVIVSVHTNIRKVVNKDKMKNVITADIQEILGRRVTTRSKCKKIQMLSEVLNTTKYEVLGFPGGGNKVNLRIKFHNKRDRKGRFARIVR